MAKTTREMKDKIQALVSKGKHEKALALCRELFKMDKHDMTNVKRIGDLSLRIGDRPNAIRAYEVVGKNYMAEGFEIKAVAIAKILIEQDPQNGWANQQLKDVVQPPKAKPPKEEEAEELVLEDEVIESGPRMAPEEMKKHGVGLVTNELFEGFTPQECLKVLTKMQLKRFEPGDIICKNGGDGESIMLISDGHVQIQKNEKPITDLMTGTFFGEFGFFADKKRHADVVAVEPTDILEISKDDFEEIIEEHPNVADVLVNIYKVRVLDLVLGLTNLFESLDTDTRLSLVENFELLTCGKGQRVITEGEPGDAMFIIKDGAVEVFTQQDGEKKVLAVLREGEYFGEGSLVTGKPRTASVVAMEKLACMKLSKEFFDRVCGQYPAVKKAAESTVIGRAQDTIEQLLSHEDSARLI